MLQIADTMAQSLHFLLTTKITKEENEKKNTEKNILDFLREKVILEQVSDFSSERLLKRFLYKFPSFQTKNQINNCRDLKSRTINTIGEFILISLGIISPKMFKLYNFSIEPEKIDDLIKNTDYTREELTNLFNYYNLRGINGKPIFYNRRFTENQIPSKETDELVKDFIKELKTYENEILKSFWYEEFKKNVITTRTDRSIDLEEKYDIIIEELNNKLADKNFIKTIIQILVNYRYKDVYTLINPKK